MCKSTLYTAVETDWPNKSQKDQPESAVGVAASACRDPPADNQRRRVQASRTNFENEDIAEEAVIQRNVRGEARRLEGHKKWP